MNKARQNKLIIITAKCQEIGVVVTKGNDIDNKKKHKKSAIVSSKQNNNIYGKSQNSGSQKIEVRNKVACN